MTGPVLGDTAARQIRDQRLDESAGFLDLERPPVSLVSRRECVADSFSPAPSKILCLPSKQWEDEGFQGVGAWIWRVTPCPIGR